MVTFNGISKIITIDNGIEIVSVKDIYSAWKVWLQNSNNSKYLPAFKAIGGEELGGGLFLSPTYFLTNGWRVRPYEGNHILYVNGNLYVEEGGDPFVSTIGNYNVRINMQTSSIVTTVVVATGSAVTSQDKTDIIQGVKANTDPMVEAVNDNIDSIKPTLTNILGLLQHNFRYDNQVYDGNGNLSSATVTIYPSGNDMKAKTNSITSYSIEAIYDSNNRLNDYKVWENI